MSNFFKEELTPKIIKTKEGKAIIPGSRPLNMIIKDKSMVEFLSKIFVFRPSERLKPLDALMDPWIVDELPEGIKQQHLSYVKMKLIKYYENIEDKKTPSKNTVKKHTKRNSDFHGSQKPRPNHTRRRSDGFH